LNERSFSSCGNGRRVCGNVRARPQPPTVPTKRVFTVSSVTVTTSAPRGAFLVEVPRAPKPDADKGGDQSVAAKVHPLVLAANGHRCAYHRRRDREGATDDRDKQLLSEVGMLDDPESHLRPLYKYGGQSIAGTWLGRLRLASRSALIRGRLAAPLNSDAEDRRRHRRQRGRNTAAPYDLLVGGDTPPFARREGWTLVIRVSGYSTSRGVGIRGGNVPAGNGQSLPVSRYRLEARS
jgi:hypothetical protein